jgi:DNA-binding NarL/FixJ family response regulator
MNGRRGLRPSVLIADDHRVVAEALGEALSSHYTVHPPVTELAELVATIRERRPDVVLLDLSFAGESSLPMMERALGRGEIECRFVVLTAHESSAMARAAFEAGASGYLLKGCSSADLRRAIDAAAEGRRLIPAVMGSKGSRSGVFSRGAPSVEVGGIELRAGQVAVLLMLHEGLSRQAIARRLRVSLRGVDHHIMSAKRALGIADLKLVVRWVAEHQDALRKS